MADIVIGYTRDIIPEKVVYTGHETPTAVTIVDNTTQEIGVEVKDSVLGDKISNTDGSIVIKELVDHHDKEISVNISNKDGNLLSLDSENGLYAYLDTEPFTTRDEYDGLNNSVNSIKRTYATKTWVENKGYITQDKLDDKQDTLTPGENITIKADSEGKLVISASAESSEDYLPLKNKPSVNGKELIGDLSLKDLGIDLDKKADISYVNDEVISLENEILLKQDALTAGENVTIETVGDKTIISSLGGDVTIGKKLVVTNTVGGITAGTVFEADTKMADILDQLLTGSAPVIGATVYRGLVSSIPITEEEIESLTLDESKTRDYLLTSGYEFRRISPEDQFVVLAIPKDLGLCVEEITVSGFGIGYNEIEIGNYYLYAESYPVTMSNVSYKYKFGEV